MSDPVVTASFHKGLDTCDITITQGGQARQGTTGQSQNGVGTYRLERSDSYTEDDTASTLSARDYKSATDLIQIGAIDLQQVTSKINRSTVTREAPPLTTKQQIVTFGVATLGHTQSNGLGVYQQDIANTLESGSNQAVIMDKPLAFQWNASVQDGLPVLENITPSMRTDPLAVQQSAMVRRLTPLECERLQAFPDGWTAVDNMPDSARYRFMGNAVTVNVAEFIGRRVMEYGT